MNEMVERAATVSDEEKDKIEMIQSLLTEDSEAVGVLAYSSDWGHM